MSLTGAEGQGSGQATHEQPPSGVILHVRGQAIYWRRWVLWALLAVWGLTLLRGTVGNGDAALYLQQVQHGSLRERSVHAGYLWTLHGFLSLWSPLVGSDGWLTWFWLDSGAGAQWPALFSLPDGLMWTAHGRTQARITWGMQLFSWLWGLVGCYALVKLSAGTEDAVTRYAQGAAPGPASFKRSGTWTEAAVSLLPALLWLSCPPVLKALTTGEVESMAWGLGLLSVWQWQRQQPLLGALLLGVALTVTPLMVTLLPVLLVLELRNAVDPGRHQGRLRRWGALMLTVLPLLLVWGLTGTDWFTGPRGVLSAPPGMSLVERLELRLGELPSSLGLTLLWVVPGVMALWPAQAAKSAETDRFDHHAGRFSLHRRRVAAILASAFFVWVLDRYRDIPAWGLTAALCMSVLSPGLVPLLKSPEPVDGRRSERGRALLQPWLVWGLILVQLVLADQSVRRTRRAEAKFLQSCFEPELGAVGGPRVKGLSESASQEVRLEGQGDRSGAARSFSDTQRCLWYQTWVAQDAAGL